MKTAFRWVLGVLMIGAGILHFVRPEFYLRIMPPYLPWHRELVFISGVFEVTLGALLLVPRYSRFAAWGLIALFVAVFPANVHMALHAEQYPRFPEWALWARLPLQGVLIAWAYWFTRPPTVPSGEWAADERR